MTGPVELLNHAAGSWWLYMANAACQSALVGLLLLAIVYLARKWSSALKYWILVIALAKFAFPTLLPSPTGLFTWLGPVAHLDARTADSTTEETQTDGRALGDPTLATRVNAERTLDDLTRASRAESEGKLSVEAGVWTVEWRAWLLLIYVGGLLVLAWRVLREMLLLRRLAWHSQEIVGGELHDCLKTIGSQFHMNRLPRLMHSPDVGSPVAFGAFRPTIVIPTRMIDRFHRQDFEIVLAHEMAHVCRGDIWLNWLQVVVCAAWWFHPVAWVISRALSKVREDCCDDLILAWNVADRTRYCDTLLKIAREMKDPVLVGAAVGMSERFHPLSKRLTRILKGAVPPSSTVSAAGWVVLLVGAVVLLPGSRYGDVVAGPETASDQHPALAGANSVAHDENTYSSEAGAGSYETTMNSMPREPRESLSAEETASASTAAASAAPFQMDSVGGKTAVKSRHRVYVVSADGTKSVQLDREGSSAAWPLDASRGTPAVPASGPQICIHAPPDDKDADDASQPTPQVPFRPDTATGGDKSDDTKKPEDTGETKAKRDRFSLHVVKLSKEQVEQLAWGKESHGLRAALLFEPQKNVVAMGDILKQSYVVRNAGETPLELTATPWLSTDLTKLDVVDQVGKAIAVERISYSGLMPLDTCTLRPGEAVKIPLRDLSIGPGEFDDPCPDILKPTLGQTCRLRGQLSIEQVSSADGDDANEGRSFWLGTGVIEFKVLESPD